MRGNREDNVVKQMLWLPMRPSVPTEKSTRRQSMRLSVLIEKPTRRPSMQPGMLTVRNMPLLPTQPSVPTEKPTGKLSMKSSKNLELKREPKKRHNLVRITKTIFG